MIEFYAIVSSDYKLVLTHIFKIILINIQLIAYNNCKY